MTVYVVTYQEPWEHGVPNIIVGIYSTREAAEEEFAKDKYDSFIEEYELDVSYGKYVRR